MQPSIQARIERYASSEIRFNLMAVVADRRATLRSQLQASPQLLILGRLGLWLDLST